MKYTLSVLIVLLISTVAFTQSKKAEAIIEEVTTKTQAYNSVEFEFTFTYEDPGSDENISEEGKLLISGEKYVLNIEGQKVICDGSTIWTYIEDAWEVQILDYH